MHTADDIHTRATRIKLLILDVDGTLTDGRVILSDGGAETKVFHVRDGQGMVMLREAGVHIAVITGRRSQVVAERMAALGIHYLYQGVDDKLTVFTQLLQELNISAAQCAYLGDDLPDVPVLRRVGLACAVADAHSALLPHVHYVTRLRGGLGAAREVCDLILEAQGRMTQISAKWVPA